MCISKPVPKQNAILLRKSHLPSTDASQEQVAPHLKIRVTCIVSIRKLKIVDQSRNNARCEDICFIGPLSIHTSPAFCSFIYTLIIYREVANIVHISYRTFTQLTLVLTTLCDVCVWMYVYMYLEARG